MRTKAQIVTVGVAALALGYALGVGRADRVGSNALAGPADPAGPAGPSATTTHITSDPGGTNLVVWTLKNGEVVSARATILLDDRTIDPKGLHITNPRLTATTYAFPTAETPK